MICFECGSEFVPVAKSGRFREYQKGLFLAIPADFKIPTCITCDEELWSPELSRRLDFLLRKEYLLGE